MSAKKTAPDSLRNLKGIGQKTEEAFHRAGIMNLRDLIRYYPREYDSFEEPVPVGRCVADIKNAVVAKVTSRPVVRTFGKKSITILNLQDETGTLQVNWFHMPFLRNTIKIGVYYVFRGPVIAKGGRKIMEHPQLYTREEYMKLTGQMLPIYPLTAGLTNNMVRKAVTQLLEMQRTEEEILPDTVREEEGLCEINFARSQIHFPENSENLLIARNRLAFEEFFLFLLGVERLRAINDTTENHFPMREVWETEDVIASLPYKLTGAQQAVWGEIEKDLASKRLMNRLVQGDVGSGKTILAFLAMIMAYENGFQSALMVPTEVLAVQHYQAFTELLEKNGITDLCPVLLRGSCTAKEKREIYEQISSGKTRAIIGTHALIQEKVEYEKLGLVITDEQHRFGVKQREALAGKGYPPNVLVMSATPIPRTLAMILYGDLDISILNDMPAHRLPIKNCVVNTSYRDTAYRFMRKEVEAGHQVYVICPMVEPNEELSCENVTEYAQKLKNVFGSEIAVEALHGQMRPKEKQEIMDAFARGEIKILVSTTVIEVGVNVPNATVMMIENAERFGLAQLHQLRGRVGRGDAQSYCIFMQGDGKKETSERLDILNHSNDGFYIAEEDLKLRGPGDLFGVRQSGIALFQIADIYRDKDLLRRAGTAVKDLLELDPDLELPQNRALAKALQEYLSCQNDDIEDINNI
uniref:ATP-dependent DNA helicase RecG n=1 Tax=Eubacterium cellulosolvens (strain ATCC 43171 / JCM 9499 / 6) TaxID=633697 RepID=I5AQK0_EUBC6